MDHHTPTCPICGHYTQWPARLVCHLSWDEQYQFIHITWPNRSDRCDWPHWIDSQRVTDLAQRAATMQRFYTPLHRGELITVYAS